MNRYGKARKYTQKTLLSSKYKRSVGYFGGIIEVILLQKSQTYLPGYSTVFQEKCKGLVSYIGDRSLGTDPDFG